MTASPRARRWGTRRTRKIWISIAGTVVGVVIVTLFGVWLQGRRETDLTDPTIGVTANAQHEIPDSAPDIRFREMAEELGIVMRHAPGTRRRTLPEDTGSGLAWSDYDGDGDFDLYLVNFTAPPEDHSIEGSNRLFRNDGTGFIDVTEQAGVEDTSGFGMGATFVDFDGDGDQDLYVTNDGPNRLYRNNGDGTFDDIAATAGVDDPSWSVSAAWGDFDRDGLIDLYVANYVDFDVDVVAEVETVDPNWGGIPLSLNPNAFDPEPNRLYRQLADGQFEEVALLVGASDPTGRSLGVAAADLDADGWLDLYVANDVSPNTLLLNRASVYGEMLFEDRSAASGTADPRGSMGISVAELGGGGGDLPDLFITHWVAQENALYQAEETAAQQLEYRDRARQLSLAEVSLDRVGWGCGFLDLDLDGLWDLVVVNGSTLEEGSPPRLAAQSPFLFWNSGERFYDLGPVAGVDFAAPRVARGLAFADYDLDGDVDLAVSINRGRPQIFNNQSQTGGDWLTIRLLADPALTGGSRISLQVGERVQRSWWRADASYASGHAPETTLGMGREAADWLSVDWLHGSALRFLRPPGRRTLVIGPTRPRS